MTDYVREKLTDMVKDMTEEEKELCLEVLKEWEQSEKGKMRQYGFIEKRFMKKE